MGIIALRGGERSGVSSGLQVRCLSVLVFKCGCCCNIYLFICLLIGYRLAYMDSSKSSNPEIRNKMTEADLKLFEANVIVIACVYFHDSRSDRGRSSLCDFGMSHQLSVCMRKK